MFKSFHFSFIYYNWYSITIIILLQVKKTEYILYVWE